MSRKILAAALGVAIGLAGSSSATTFTVTNTLDFGPGSLRDAIIQANANGLTDTIVFNIGGGGLQTIVPFSPLPPLTDPAGVFIDGFSQPGGAGSGVNPPATATLLIELDGTLAGAAEGLSIQCDNNFVQGLVVNRFQLDGIHVLGGAANWTADNNVLFCNFVGTDPTGTLDLGNGVAGGPLLGGIHISNSQGGGIAQNNTVDANLVSGNWSDGIWIAGPIQPGFVGSNIVTRNYVGTDVGGTANLGNDHDGITLTEGTTNNFITSNLSSGNGYAGVGLTGYNNAPFPLPPIQTRHNTIDLNIIGLDINLNPLPNMMHGVSIGEYGQTAWGCADQNQVIQNVIAHNGTDGICVVEDWIDTVNADSNLISKNAIWSNGGLGIDLGHNGFTNNDPGDPDTGPNEEVNFPAITSIVYTMPLTTISGMLDISTNPALATVEVFLARPDPSGRGEGYWYVGTTTPGPTGSWSLVTDRLAPGDPVTATTTDMLMNTSEFCPNATVPGTTLLAVSGHTIPQRLGGVIGFALTAGAANGNRIYAIAGSASGTVPGTPFGSVIVPLNYDVFTTMVLTGLNTPPFQNFAGLLTPGGTGNATLNTLGPLPPSWTGTVLHFAYVLLSPPNFTSHPVAIEIVPW